MSQVHEMTHWPVLFFGEAVAVKKQGFMGNLTTRMGLTNFFIGGEMR